jgi:hypothetical protein
MYPTNGYVAQAPNIVHFGLADADSADSLTIRWPSGKVQVLNNLKGDRHVVVEEGKDEVETVVPGSPIAP